MVKAFASSRGEATQNGIGSLAIRAVRDRRVGDPMPDEQAQDRRRATELPGPAPREDPLTNSSRAGWGSLVADCPQTALKTRHETVKNRVGTGHQRDAGSPCPSWS
jgi:predicted nucleic acid-binding Zn ribbon protein